MAYKVPFIDYPAHYGQHRQELLDRIDRMLSAGDVMLRGQLRDFEAHYAAFVGAAHCYGVGNGTDGLQLALLAAGIGTGDEVITVSHTMVATAAAIHHAGATPVLVDIAGDHLMDMDRVEEAITPRTKAIMPVHLNGRLCDMDRLMGIAEKHRLLVIEDAAQAVGASFNATKAGAFGIAGAFSFYPAKILGTYGDAGAVVTSDPEVAERVRLLRNHGRTETNDVAFWSFNSRMDNLHAVILDMKLQWLPDWLLRRREIAQQYQEMLAGVSELVLPPAPAEEGVHHDVFQNYEVEAEDRDGLVDHLRNAGIEIMLPWGGKAVHQFANLGLGHFADRLPATERLFPRLLLLPMYCELADGQVEYVAKAVRGFYGS